MQTETETQTQTRTRTDTDTDIETKAYIHTNATTCCTAMPVPLEEMEQFLTTIVLPT
jgi:hypothetical protein